MNELHFANRVRQYLNRGLQNIEPSTTDRLAAARERALARQRVTVRVGKLAGAGAHFHFGVAHPNRWLAILVLALGIGGYVYWTGQEQLAELTEIDSALLADDVPIGALTDKGFDAWLKDSGEPAQ